MVKVAIGSTTIYANNFAITVTVIFCENTVVNFDRITNYTSYLAFIKG